MSGTPLGSLLGLDPELEALYRSLRSADGARVEDVALARDVDVAELHAQVAGLVELGIVDLSDGTVHVAARRQALAAALQSKANALADDAQRLAHISAAVLTLDDEPARPAEADTRLDAEVINGIAPVELLVAWITESKGELMFMRPDQWRFPHEPVIAEAFKVALAQGRRARGIYPVRALHQARSMLMDRAAAGEEIRLLPEVPSRLGIVGENRALLPHHPGVAGERAVVLRDSGMVATLKLYFEQMWDQAVALPAADSPGTRSDERRLLLAELAEGARDEQIARTLGIGLRTVRRRIAHLMIELGVETRFQAGVEAVRRGWL